jgi:hypothetical protein
MWPRPCKNCDRRSSRTSMAVGGRVGLATRSRREADTSERTFRRWRDRYEDEGADCDPTSGSERPSARRSTVDQECTW